LVDAIRLNMKENNMPPDSVCFIFNDSLDVWIFLLEYAL
jgi:hypothetical protein